MPNSSHNSSASTRSGATRRARLRVGAAARARLATVWPAAVLALIPIAYGATLARRIVVGDPTEYTFVAHTLTIAHPPGYAFLTLAGKLIQTLVPIGDAAQRMHLIGLLAGTAAAVGVYAMLRALGRLTERPAVLPALLAAPTVAWATNFWQHAVHANPHIVTAAFVTADLWLLTRWYAAHTAGQPHAARWLYAFAFTAGLGVTHHPLTAFALPACSLFVLLVWPRLLLRGRVLLTGAFCALLGLLPWLYFPLRAPALVGTRFPSDMQTWDGFLNLTLARGLRANLFYFGPADQWERLIVFWTLLRLQYTLPVLFLAIVGLGWLLTTRRLRPLALLYGGAFLTLTGFVINTVQDVMAYLLTPFLLIGLAAGVGLVWLLHGVERRFGRTACVWLTVALVLLGPLINLTRNAPRVSLRDYREGDDYIAAVREQFDGRGERAVLLNDWEHMTPLWYEQMVRGGRFDPADVEPIFVAADKPWLAHVFERLPGGPVYLNRFERSVFDAGFRLRARGAFQQVVEPGDASLPPELTPLQATFGELEAVGYRLPTAAAAGDFTPFVLALRAPGGTADFYAPLLTVGPLSFPFTTDSHLITPAYLPGEVIVEEYHFALPFDLPAGDYPVALTLQNLTGPVVTEPAQSLGVLRVAARPFPPATGHLAANFRQRVGLVGATARLNGRRVAAPWQVPPQAQSGDVVRLTLEWQALVRSEDSYTVFVHLIDAADRPLLSLDYTPLGGAAPTHLWFPKWLPGQRLLDPYRMDLSGIPPGDYWIEVGLYEQFTQRRLHMHDAAGNLIGDRLILGPLQVR